MASPITQPKNRLFRRAILLDGTALSPWAMVDHPQQYFMRVAQELNVSHWELISELVNLRILVRRRKESQRREIPTRDFPEGDGRHCPLHSGPQPSESDVRHTEDPCPYVLIRIRTDRRWTGVSFTH